MTTPAWLRCDVPGCNNEMDIAVRGEKRCLAHAVEAANAHAIAVGKPPISLVHTPIRPDDVGKALGMVGKVVDKALNHSDHHFGFAVIAQEVMPNGSCGVPQAITNAATNADLALMLRAVADQLDGDPPAPASPPPSPPQGG